MLVTKHVPEFKGILTWLKSLVCFLLQQATSTGFHVFLEDTSSNGTFINGEKVGKLFAILKEYATTVSIFYKKQLI